MKYYYTDKILGNRYGDWIVVGEGEDKIRDGYHLKTIRCMCCCGVCKEETRDVLASNLLNGNSNGCGIKSKSLNGKNNKKYNKYDLSGEYGVGVTNSGYEFYFDLEDYEKIKDFCWHRHQDGYLRTRVDVVDGKNIYALMHRYILDVADKTVEVDHINGDYYDNRKSNLRLCDHNKNMKNTKLYNNNTSGVKGVYFSNREGKWKAYITCDKKQIHLGTFDNLDEAISVRKEIEIKMFKEYMRKECDL